MMVTVTATLKSHQVHLSFKAPASADTHHDQPRAITKLIVMTLHTMDYEYLVFLWRGKLSTVLKLKGMSKLITKF